MQSRLIWKLSSLVALMTVLDAGSLDAAPQKNAKSAKAFVDAYNRERKELLTRSNRSEWVQVTFITEDTEILYAEDKAALLASATKALREAKTYDKIKVDPDVRRQLDLIKMSASSDPAPSDPTKLKELTTLTGKMTGLYGKGKICDDWSKKSKFDADKDSCLDIEEITILLSKSSDPEELKTAWTGWQHVGAEMRPLYEKFVKLTNEGAQEFGYHDMGEFWRSRYEMKPQAFSDEIERLWLQVKPLYEDLQCYTKNKLQDIYPKENMNSGRIPSQLLGNLWAQNWSNIYSKLEPFPGESPADITKALVDKKYDPIKMVKLGESFFTSMGFEPLPKTFYERSMLVKPRDRDVVCHASAWDVTSDADLRIKMCIQINEDNLITIHHELGHIFYYQSYYKLPVIYQEGANDGFHEAIGDAIALSVNPTYLKQVGLVEGNDALNEKAMINVQMQSALSKIAFLPFGYLMDRWRWDVFSGQTPPSQYNKAWWELKDRYQGVSAPENRDEAFFDPGAKYHVAANVPYARYFLAHILQFQMFKSMCEISGHKGPLATCSLYGQKAAGEKLKSMLALGASKPWPEALKQLTGTDKMDANAILDYYGPLHQWLKEQNKGKSCGWNK